LEEKGDIALNDLGYIIDAYPWTSRKTDISIYLGSENPIKGPFKTAGALYAMSAMRLFEPNGKIEAAINDNRETLIIQIENGEIVYTNKIAAVVYRTDEYEDSRFFSSPDGAQKRFGERYNKDRVLRLDKALAIGDIIAQKLKEKTEN
jgi:hypothetical protein